MSDIIGKVFAGMFTALFVIYLLIYGFASVLPTASAITIWGIDFGFIGLIISLAVVLGSGYAVTRHFTSGWK